MKSNNIWGDLKPCYIIAEMSANHGGDFNRAVEIMHEAKKSGADCIKVQTYTADTMTIDCDNEYFKISDGTWEGENLYNLYEKASTPWEWQRELKSIANKIGLDFLSTPFDKTAVDFLESIDVECYKIASFELTDLPLIKYVASKGKPIIISIGMGSIGEVDEAIKTIKSTGNENICVLKCSSAYPAITDGMNLNTIPNIEETFGVSAGLSDHSFGHIGAVTAVVLGAKVIEKHLCLSRSIDTADSSFSMEPLEFRQMVDAVREAEKAMGTIEYGLTKMEKTNHKFRRSIFITKDIKQGDIFTEDNIKVIRPGYGLEPKFYEEILGKKANVNVKRGTPLSWNMVE